MDPLHAPVSTKYSPSQESKTSSKGSISSQLAKISDLGEKGKARFKASILTGSKTFEKVKNYFGASKLNAAKYKNEVLNQLPDSDLKNQIKALDSINDIRIKLMESDSSTFNSIDAIATFKGRSRTLKSDYKSLKTLPERIASSLKDQWASLNAPIDDAKRLKDKFLKNIDKELASNKNEYLLALREEVSNAGSLSEIKVAIHKYQLLTHSQETFEKETKVDPVRYKKSVLSQLEQSRAKAEIQDESTLNHDRLRKILDSLDHPKDIEEAISYYFIDDFDPDEVKQIAKEVSRFSSVDHIQDRVKNTLQKIKNLK